MPLNVLLHNTKCIKYLFSIGFDYDIELKAVICERITIIMPEITCRVM